MIFKLNKYFFFILVLFIFLFPVNRFVRIEPYLIWKVSKQDPANPVLEKFYLMRTGRQKKNYFFHNNALTFFSNNGKIISTYKIPPGFLCSAGTGQAGAVLYSNDRDKISFIQKERGRTWDFLTYAYPFLTLNNSIIFLITGENGGYGVLDINGQELAKSVSSGLFVTTFDIAARTNLVFIGYANGYAKLFDEHLRELWFKQFLDSNIQITKKVAVSSHGKYFAVLAGSEKEYMYLLDRHGDILLKYPTGENRQRSVDMTFSLDERYLLEESQTGFRVYSTDHEDLVFEKRLYPASHERRMLCLDISSDGMYILVCYQKMTDVTVLELYDRKGTMYDRHFFENETPFAAFSYDRNNFCMETKDNFYVYGF